MNTRKYALRAAPLLQRPVLSLRADWHAPHLCGTGLSIRKVAPNGVRRSSLVHSEICTASTCSVHACGPACSTSLRHRPVHAESVTEWHAPHLACKRKCVPCAASLLHRPALSMHAEWHAPHLCGARAASLRHRPALCMQWQIQIQQVCTTTSTARALVEPNLKHWCCPTRSAAEVTVVLIDALEQLRHQLDSFCVTRLVKGTNTKHQVVSRLLLLGTLEEARPAATQPELCTGLLEDRFHVLPTGAKHFSCDLELGFHLDVNEELALRLRGSRGPRWSNGFRLLGCPC